MLNICNLELLMNVSIKQGEASCTTLSACQTIMAMTWSTDQE